MAELKDIRELYNTNAFSKAYFNMQKKRLEDLFSPPEEVTLEKAFEAAMSFGPGILAGPESKLPTTFNKLLKTSEAEIPNVYKVKKMVPDKFYKLGEVLDFDELYKAYPDLKQTTIYLGKESSYNPIHDVIEISDQSNILHEVQHAIQKREPTFPAGTNLFNIKRSDILKEYENVVKENSFTLDTVPDQLEDVLMSQAAYNLYYRTAGEIQARAGAAPVAAEIFKQFKPEEVVYAIKDQIAKEIQVYHGSGVPNITEFLEDFIGTGEGAQAFGWGFYFTEKEGIAGHYAQKLGKMPKISETSDEDIFKIAEYLRDKKGYFAGGIPKDVNELRSKLINFKNKSGATEIDLKEAAHDVIKPGKVYKVTLHKGELEHDYLEWYKPVTTEQLNKIEKQITKENPNIPGNLKNQIFYWKKELELYGGERIPGKHIYQEIRNELGSAEAASKFLDRAGIKGIKYPTESLSGKTSKEHNYVVFNPKNITVEK